MAETAQITSLAALESFRARLIVYLGQARPVLEEVGTEVMRTRQWLQDDRGRFWEGELRRRRQRLEEARQELFTASISSLHEATPMHHLAVQRAQRAVQEAEDKLKIMKKWDRELDNRTAPLMKQVEQLHGFLFNDMSRAVAQLDQMLKALEAYTDVMPGGTGAGANMPPAASQTEPSGGQP
jgi:hypothetical protein